MKIYRILKIFITWTALILLGSYAIVALAILVSIAFDPEPWPHEMPDRHIAAFALVVGGLLSWAAVLLKRRKRPWRLATFRMSAVLGVALVACLYVLDVEAAPIMFDLRGESEFEFYLHDECFFKERWNELYYFEMYLNWETRADGMGWSEEEKFWFESNFPGLVAGLKESYFPYRHVFEVCWGR
jgi:hypothetical protein